MIYIASAIYALKALIAASIFFVWVVRYQNIIEEFKLYELPAWLRDLVGILKLSFALMLYSSDINVVLLGASGITVLMVAAVLTHLRVKNPFYKMVPSMSLIVFSSVIFLYTYRSQ
ncbi:MAG: hypothetical protein NPINA01_18770 [Nitrospinaceae bacterium]|nr:MAG: hypothetical protein NPINA01_18770 [Nitrospinaceae bacterium]